jgi:hypothetical protein
MIETSRKHEPKTTWLEYLNGFVHFPQSLDFWCLSKYKLVIDTDLHAVSGI